MPIGTKETDNTLKPAKVKIVNITLKTETNDGEKMKTPLAEINVKHPDTQDLIKMTKIKLLRADKLIVVSTWVQLSEEEGIQKIQKSSALADLMKFLNVETLEDLYGKEVETVEQSAENKYLCIKAY
jgi:hypothetical protein